jgi:hypothetical protein
MKNAAAFQARTAKFGGRKFILVAGGRETDLLGKRVLRIKKGSDGLQAGGRIGGGDDAGVFRRLRQRDGVHGGKGI